MLARMSWNIVAQVFGLMAGLLDRLVLVGLMIRAWGLETFADWTVVTSSALLFGVCELGMQLHFLNLMQAAHVKGDRAGFDRAFGVAKFCYAAMAATFCALIPLALWGATSAGWFRTSNLGPAATQTIFLALAFSSVITIIRGPYSIALMARGQFSTATNVGTLTFAGMVLASIAALAFGASPAGLALLQCLWSGPIAIAVLYWADARSRSKAGLPAPGGIAIPRQDELSSIAHHVKWFAVQQVGPLVLMQLPVTLMTGFGVESRALASFILLRMLINIMRLLTGAMSAATGIEIASVMHDDGAKQAWGTTQRVGWIASVAVGALAPAILVFGPRFVELWTKRGDVFDPLLIALLLLPVVATIPLQQLSTHLQFAGLSALVGRPRLIQLLATAPAGWFGLIIGGTHGLAAALAIVEIGSQWWIVPSTAKRSEFDGLMAYVLRCFAGIAAFILISAACAGIGQFGARSIAHPVLGFLVAGGLWAALIAVPLLWATNIGHVRERLTAHLRPRTSV
jgi:hypothetical protein